MLAREIDVGALAREAAGALDLEWLPELRFLARGEYSLNYVTSNLPEPLVVRCVTGSQIGLALDAQVHYEARALQLLAGSGRTPRWLATVTEPEEAPFPFLIETYLPGRPLDYATDLVAAAGCVAAIHELPVVEEHGLQAYPEPGPAIVAESREWATAYLSWQDGPPDSQAALLRAVATVEAEQERAGELFAAPELVYVNYDLNTHNFIVRAEDGFVSLVDWEKARVAPVVQDLAHFLLPTTTLWRATTSTLLTAEQEQLFVATYLAARPRIDPTLFSQQLAAMKRLIALRAVSWCSWAVCMAATSTRAITDVETIERSRFYLEPAFLEALFAH